VVLVNGGWLDAELDQIRSRYLVCPILVRDPVLDQSMVESLEGEILVPGCEASMKDGWASSSSSRIRGLVVGGARWFSSLVK
jgi:hypothetical protein